jgi:hypothetical protein
MGYDLTLEAPQGILLSQEELQKVEQALRQETKLDYLCELTLHFGGRRPRGRSQALSEYINDGVFKREEYVEFCTQQNLAPDQSEAEADAVAHLFVSYKWSQDIITARMPRDREGIVKAYRLMVDFAQRHNLVIKDPQIGKYIDLDNPGDLPPMYAPDTPKKRWWPWSKRH